MSRTWLTPKLMFFWLVVGYGVIHAMFGGWASAIVGSALASSLREYLQIAENGEPVVMQYESGSNSRHRRLDGTPLTELEVSRLKFDNYPASLTREHGQPADWEKRIDTFLDFRQPATCWYLIAPFDHPGTAYLQGYEPLSKRLIGYIGKNGFTSSPPARADRFNISPSQYVAFSGISVASQKIHTYGLAYEPGSNYSQSQNSDFANAPPDAVWLLCQGTLYEIHLGDRTVQTLAENQHDWKSLSRTVVKEGDRSLLQLAVRTEQGLELIIPGTETRKTIPLKPEMPLINEQFYQLPNGQQLVTRTTAQTNFDSENLTEIVWLDGNGSVVRQETFSLANQQESSSVWNAAFLVSAPCPSISVGALLLVPAFAPLGFQDHLTYSSRLAEFATAFSPWILGTILIGLITAWRAWKRERDVFHTRDWTWPILVGLTGWFGWMAYICLKPLPARLPNRQWLPAQPEPNRPLGTEIFA